MENVQPSLELGITNRNELYKRDGFDIMRDLGAIEEYFVVRGANLVTQSSMITAPV